jgi:hypothetical protein
MHKLDDAMETVRQELRTMLKRGTRVTERELLRLSAQTGLDYSTVVRIQQELS